MCLLGLITGSACKIVVIKNAPALKSAGNNNLTSTSTIVQGNNKVNITTNVNTLEIDTTSQRTINNNIERENESLSQKQLDTKAQSSNKMILPVMIGFVAGIIVTIGIVLIVKYVKKCEEDFWFFEAFRT